MYCRECGQRLDNDALFCFHCGAGQEVIEEPAPTAEPEKEYCIQCGAELRQGAAFCVRCGAGRAAPPTAEPIPEMAYCIQCGAKLEGGAAFCLMCGARQDDETPVMAPPLDTAPALPGETKKKGRKGFIALAAVLFLASATAAALLVTRPWEAREAAAPAESQAPLREAAPEEKPEAPAAAEPPDLTDAAAPAPETPAPETPAPETPAPAPTAAPAAYTAVPITEGDYALICHETGMHLGIDAALDGESMIMSDFWEVLSDRSFSITLADGDFNSGYHMAGSFGTLRFTPGEPPAVHGFTGGQEDARWQFSAAEGDMYSIHLVQAPGYALAHAGDRVFLAPYDPTDPRQYWILTDPEAVGRQEETDDLSQFIYGLSSRSITMDELYGLDEDTMGYIRNGIFALGGKIFKTQKYREYFGAQSWYTPYSEDDDLVAARFNGHMKHNLNVCIEYEELMGWR